MTEHKYTDEEVIKALECCAVDPKSGKFSDCKNCPLDAIEDANCFNFMIQQYALDLINRQKAEIEDLREIVFMDRTEAIKNLKSEAVKEFADKLEDFEEVVTSLKDGEPTTAVETYYIHEFVKKFTEEKT